MVILRLENEDFVIFRTFYSRFDVNLRQLVGFDLTTHPTPSEIHIIYKKHHKNHEKVVHVKFLKK